MNSVADPPVVENGKATIRDLMDKVEKLTLARERTYYFRRLAAIFFGALLIAAAGALVTITMTGTAIRDQGELTRVTVDQEVAVLREEVIELQRANKALVREVVELRRYIAKGSIGPVPARIVIVGSSGGGGTADTVGRPAPSGDPPKSGGGGGGGGPPPETPPTCVELPVVGCV